MGQHGQIPKRSTQRRRRNKESQPDIVRATGQVRRPAVSPHWHQIAKDWFRSLGESGQSQFFEPSDWRAAQYVAEAITQNLNAGRFSAQLFGVVWSAMGDLLTTEAERRRSRLEIERETGATAPEDDGVASLDEYRARTG